VSQFILLIKYRRFEKKKPEREKGVKKREGKKVKDRSFIREWTFI